MNRKLIIIGVSVVLGLAATLVLYGLVVKGSASRPPQAAKADTKEAVAKTAVNVPAKTDSDSEVERLEALASKDSDPESAERAIVSLASIYERRNNLLRAQELYQKAIERFPASKDVAGYQEVLDNLNMKILFSPVITQDSISYEIEKGDTLSKLAKKFNTTVELIQRSNNLQDAVIKYGRKLKISKARFSIVVDKSQNILTLKEDDRIVKTYRVSTGKDYSTPTGNFVITNKLTNPTWYTAGAVVPADSPKNILGSRWLGISKEGYGIHGTTDPGSIGTQVTAGCVRLTNPDVEELYAIVPEGTEVVIID